MAGIDKKLPEGRNAGMQQGKKKKAGIGRKWRWQVTGEAPSAVFSFQLGARNLALAQKH